MAYNPPLRGVAYKFYVAMTAQANPKTFLSAPTFASGEVQVSKDGGALANITTLPTATGRLVEVNLSATEMTADNVAVQFLDGNGEWCDLLVAIQTVDAGVPANVKQWNGTAVATPHSSGYPVVTVKDGTGTGEIDTSGGKVLLQDGAVTAAVLAANAIDADALAADAGSELAAAVWANAARTLTATLDPTAATVAAAVWNAMRASHTAAGSFGEGVVAASVSDKSGYALSAAGVTAVQLGLSTLTAAQVNAEVDAALAGVGLSAEVTGRLDAAISTRLAAGDYNAPPAAAAVAAAVWDEDMNAHNSPSTAGNKLNAASAAGDPWIASLAGYSPGSAGHLLFTQLDAAVSSRASHTAAEAAAAVWSAGTRSLANDATQMAIKAKTDLIVANGATAAQLQPAAEAAVLAQLTNIAVEIHNTDLSQIAAPGNAAQALVDAAVDPWTRGSLSGYDAGSAGRLLADTLNAPVGSRASHSAADAAAAVWAAANRTLANDATQAAIKAKTDLIVANGASVADLTPAATTAIQNARLHQLMTAAFSAPAAESLLGRLLEVAGGSWRFTAASLGQTPAVPPEIDEAAIAAAVWQASMSGWLEGTMGYRITQEQAATEEIAAAVWGTSLLPYNQPNSAGKALRDTTAFPTAGQIASNVWEIDPAAFAALNGTMGHRLSSLTPAAVSNAVWSATQSAFQTPGTFGYLFDAPVSGQPGYTDGTGAVAFTYTLTSQSDGSAIAGVRVTVSDDIAGSHVVAEAISNVAGVVIFHLDAGRYYLWREKPGWSFVDPDTQDVEG